jgi:hypothetical protein
MDTNLVGSGYNLIGTRQSTTSPGTTEFYNTQTDQGFSNPTQLSDFVNSQYGLNTNQGNVFDTLKSGYTPVSINPSTQVDSTQLTQTPKTDFDIQSLLTQNQQNYQSYLTQQQALQKQYTDLLKPDNNITTLQKQLADLRNQTLNTNLSGLAGIQAAGQKVIPMEFIVGQQQNIAQQANLKLQTLAAQQVPLVDQLNFAQQARQQTLQSLEALMQFGRDNYTTGQDQLNFSLSLAKYQNELNQITKQEETAAKQFALDQQITKPFYSIDGRTIYRTSDGKAYSTEAEWRADGGRPDLVQYNLTTPQDRALEAQYSSSKYQLSYNPITGEAQIFDPKTGQTTTPGFAPAPAGGFRTDRNNNPTALTTDVAKSMGLIEGVDYVQGDKFPGDSNLYTARLLGDPIETTIKGIDKGGFFTASGQPRWSYFSMPQNQWLALTHDQKVAVITQMYKAEGGSGQLMQTGPSIVSKTGIDTVNNIIKNSSSWGDAATAINRTFGDGAATQFDTQLKTQFQIPSDLKDLSSQAIQHGQDPSSWTLDQWQQNENQFLQDHQYNPDAAKTAFEQFFPKPGAKENAPSLWTSIGNFFKNL